MVSEGSGRWSKPRALLRRGSRGLGEGSLRRPERTDRLVEVARPSQSRSHSCGLKWGDTAKLWEPVLD